jgi:hypothetical protein
LVQFKNVAWRSSLSFLFGFYVSVGIWIGFECIEGTSNCPQKIPNHYSAGSVVSIFFCMIFPAINLNQLVSFAFPKDKSKKVLQNLNMEINCRHTEVMGESAAASRPSSK